MQAQALSSPHSSVVMLAATHELQNARPFHQEAVGCTVGCTAAAPRPRAFPGVRSGRARLVGWIGRVAVTGLWSLVNCRSGRPRRDAAMRFDAVNNDLAVGWFGGCQVDL